MTLDWDSPALDESARANGPAAHIGHAWLAAVLPAEASRIRTADRKVASTLRFAGVDVVDERADVEIASPDDLQGDAPHVVVMLGHRSEIAPSRLGRVGTRIVTSLAVRAKARLVSRQLRRRGYRHVDLVPWDVDQFIHLPRLRAHRSLSAAERFPRRAFVIAHRSRSSETVLEGAIRQAAAESGTALETGLLLLRAGTLLAIGEAGILRVSIGAGSRQIDAQERVLRDLRNRQPSAGIANRIPRILASGTTGLARWSLENRLKGAPSPHDLPDVLVDDCLEFLVDLSGLGGTALEHPVLGHAEKVASLLSAERAASLRRIAAGIDSHLGGVTPSFAHGDFCTSNLLVQGDRLSGVIDWDGGGGGRLPLLDLLHLRLLAVTRAAPDQWGDAVVRYLFPLSRGGGDTAVQRYCHAVGLDLGPHGLESLAIAYWLERVSYQIGMYAERRGDSVWWERSVERVLDELLVTDRARSARADGSTA
jgi:hypothetical protein